MVENEDCMAKVSGISHPRGCELEKLDEIPVQGIQGIVRKGKKPLKRP